jgi:4'-phosphopantetheinyl transferase
MYGKPEIVLPRDAPPVQFNLSHAGDLALVVVAFGAMVGVDCEAVHDDFEVLDVARKFFSRPEIEQIRNHPLHERCAAFTRCWTRKEALIKGIGTGLSYPLDAFSIDVDVEGAQSPRNEKAPLFWPPGWIVMNVPLRPGYQGAVAVRV